MSRLGKRLLQGWTAIAIRFGAMQTLVLLGFFYFLLVGPVALGMRLIGRDLLDKRDPSAGADPTGSDPSAWHDADTAGADLERMKLTS